MTSGVQKRSPISPLLFDFAIDEIAEHDLRSLQEVGAEMVKGCMNQIIVDDPMR